MTISIVIPTLNEELMIGKCLSHFAQSAEHVEIIVVDCGSDDETVSVVNTFEQATLINTAKKGRAHQMNLGARAATGEILLFLHADTLLPPDGLQMIENAMTSDSVAGGSFYLCFNHQSFWFKLYSWFSKINHILFTYGDQGLFMKKETFEKLGGFANLAFMEDVEIQRRLRKAGRFFKLDQCVVTSSRRFLANGLIRQQLLNTILVLLYFAGVSPTWLKRYYR